MSLRQKLTKPFVVEPEADHSHTVVFLHRFPESTTDEELPTKVLSTKRTSRNHKTLQEQFPSVRWVFPFAKTGPRPYGNLTAEDKAAVGLTKSASPYITQILLQEANLLQEHGVEGGLENVILGGQGETAVAGHEAMQSFPEVNAAIRGNPDEVAKFLQDAFHIPHWTDPGSHPRLAGYVGMHAEDTEVTRDITTYRAATMTSTTNTNPVPRVNTSILLNTPHRFIHGGYKVHNAKWDGRRIDDFAEFLARELDVYRVPDGTSKRGPSSGTKKTTATEDAIDHELSARDKYLAGLVAEKKANEDRAKLIRMRIEADKEERKIRLQTEREARFWAEQNAARRKVKNPNDSDEDNSKTDGPPYLREKSRRRKKAKDYGNGVMVDRRTGRIYVREMPRRLGGGRSRSPSVTGTRNPFSPLEDEDFFKEMDEEDDGTSGDSRWSDDGKENKGGNENADDID